MSIFLASNGSLHTSTFNDDFGRELMLANKRKYQLENKIKKMEHEVKEAQASAQHCEHSLKNTTKLLWLEKEQNATLEGELCSSRTKLEEQHKQTEELITELNRYHNREVKIFYLLLNIFFFQNF